jgi:multiple sugar transport system permease protein
VPVLRCRERSTVRLDSFIGLYTVDWQDLFGASLVTTIPVFILFALIERRVVGGLTGSIRWRAPSSPRPGR